MECQKPGKGVVPPPPTRCAFSGTLYPLCNSERYGVPLFTAYETRNCRKESARPREAAALFQIPDSSNSLPAGPRKRPDGKRKIVARKGHKGQELEQVLQQVQGEPLKLVIG